MKYNLITKLSHSYVSPILAGICGITFVSGTLEFGPTIKNEYLRYALAGTVAMVGVELFTHPIDTVNMRSKLINGQKVNAFSIFFSREFFSLFKGS
jgi:hypothetical protein